MKKLSASSMGTYEKCPKKYYYQYIEKPNISIPEWPHLEFGTVAHRVLELFHEHLIKNVVTPADWPQIMRDSAKEAVLESKKRGKFSLIKDQMNELKDIIQKYLDSLKELGLPNVLHNELDFNFTIDKFTVRGFIDRIDKLDDGVYHVVDYKTSKSPDYLTDFQLALYGLAIQEVFKDVKEIVGSYVLLKNNSKLKTWCFDEKDFERTREKVIQLGTDINTETMWEKRPTMLCNWCDFKSICQENWTDE